jgi:hypothetical protein
MTTHDDHSPGDPNPDAGGKLPFLRTSAGFVLCVFLVVAGVLLMVEHRAHVLGALPLALPLLICVGMHFFMHGQHGGHGGHGGDRDAK